MSTGRLATALAGAAIGAFVPGVGLSLGFTVGNLVGGIFFGDSAQSQTAEGPRLQDLGVTTSTYGKGIPQTYGSVRVGGNMIWSTDIVEVRSEESSGGDGGGKGGPSQPESTQVTYEYFGNFAMAFGAGKKFIRRVWANKKLIVDVSDEFAVGESKTFKYDASIFRMYLGDEVQMPDPLIEADKGVGLVPGHRGMVYMVFEQLPLRDFGNRIPQIEAELVDVASTSWAAVNDSVGGLEADNDYIDQSGFTPLGYNIDGSFINIYNRVTRVNVDVVDVRVDITTAISEAVNSGSPGGIEHTSTRHRHHVDPSSGMLSLVVNESGMTTRGGVILHVGVLKAPVPEDHIRDFRSGTWQYVDSNNFNAEFVRVYKIGGIRRLFLSTGLTNHDMLASAPFVFFNVGSLELPEILEVVKVVEQGDLGTQYSGKIDPDIVVDGLTSWNGAAYDPVNERAWFHDNGNQIVLIDSSGAGTLTDLNTILDPLHTTGGSFTVRGIAYDTYNEVLVVATDDDHFTIDPVTFAVVSSAGPNTANAISDAGAAGHTSGTTGNLWANQETIARLFYEIVSVNEIVRWNTDDITTPLQRYNETDITGDPWFTTAGPYYDPLTNALSNTTSGGTWTFIDRFGSGGIILGALVTQIVEAGGILGAADIDVTELTETVRGYVVPNPTTQRKMCEPLQQAFFFDGAEIDGKIVFKKRTGSSSQTITSDELGAKVAGQTSPQKLIEPRKQEVEVPRKIDVSYMNQDNDYQTGTQRDQRIQDDPGNSFAGITRSRQVADVRLPIVLTDAEALDICQIALTSGWVERTSLKFVLPPKFMRLDPTDIITIQKVSEALTADLTMRLTEIEMGPAGVLNCTGLLTESAVYLPNTTAQVIDGSPAGAIPFPAGTNMFLLNMPNLRAYADEEGGAYWAAAPDLNISNPAWSGAILFRAIATGEPFLQVDTTVSKVTWGLLRSTFPGHANFTTQDRTNTLQVTLQVPGGLSSITELAMFAGGNLAYIPSTGELLQFQTATLISEGTYDLTVLLRGRLGTEVFVSGTDDLLARTAIDGAEIIFLGNLSTLHRFSGFSERTLSREYEVVTLGGQLGKVGNERETFINTAAGSICLSPSNFIGTRDGSDNIDLTWNNRTRHNGELLDLVDVPLNEAGEEYEIDVLDGPDLETANVIKTVTGLTAQAYEYVVADQDADVWDTVTPSELDFTPAMVNAGFETDAAGTTDDDITGYETRVGNGWQIVVSSGDILGPDEGLNFLEFEGTTNNPTLESEKIPLAGLASPGPLNITELATNPGRFQISMTMQEGNDFDNDTGGANILFYDVDDVFLSEEVGTMEGRTAGNVWFSYTTGPVDIPTDARFFTIKIRATKVSGGNTNHVFDDITWEVTDTDSGAVQRFAFDVFQMSATTGRGRSRRVIAPAVGQ